MAVADVVGHDILDEPEAAAAGFAGQAPVVVQRAQARVDAVEIGGGVAVVGVGHLAVLQHRREPERRETHAGEVVQVVDDPLQVAAMPAAGR
jgi:hypothetical protein